ncbi:hypothetical protein [Vagococcus intermedius]|uniref:Uncharacterized protein n=1 Tax=Vagococcus intermedius TaxID=2991418 RepID=A0AAF0CWW9_9ENTE|nr:hypothetical protein [Vagococcus intermedius]WEG74382.1 hypothetical protein OL234_10780 [Vagococcus intermedius]WEG76504.1 hypothetical protein OL235_10945 [Vagococcus intermedius]
MNKKWFLIFIPILFLLASCEDNKNKIDLTGSEHNISVRNNISLSPDYATIDDDGNLLVNINWKHGSNEDSMKEMSFLQTGILFFPQQNGKDLEWDISSSQNLNREIYEASEGQIEVKFILNDVNSDVNISMTQKGESISDKLTINLN